MPSGVGEGEGRKKDTPPMPAFLRRECSRTGAEHAINSLCCAQGKNADLPFFGGAGNCDRKPKSSSDPRGMDSIEVALDDDDDDRILPAPLPWPYSSWTRGVTRLPEIRSNDRIRVGPETSGE